MKILLRVLLTIAIIILAIETTFIVLVVIERYMHPCNSIIEPSTQVNLLAVEAHNRMIDPYIDKTVKGKAIKELALKIAVYNKQADEDFIVTILYNNNNVTDENAIVLVDGNEIDDMQETMSIIDSHKNYKVTVEMDTETLIINKIIVALVNE